MSTLSGSNNPKDRIAVSKTPLGLIPGVALAHCSAALHEGMLKYTKGNWRNEKIAAATYYDAALRHIMRWIDGEEVAPDSGVHHLGHAMACLCILLDAQGSDKLIDNRPPKGNAGQTFDQIPETIKKLNDKFVLAPAIAAVVAQAPLAKPQAHTDTRVQTIECILGHEVATIDDTHGYIDGEYVQGTAFRTKVERWRRGFETIDDEIDAIQAKEKSK